MIHKTKFPLTPECILRLPEGSKVLRATVEKDISFLELALPQGPGTPGYDSLKHKDITVLTFLEGEESVDLDDIPKAREEGREPRTVPVPVPEESPELRKLGTFQTVENPATWHVFVKESPSA